MLSSLALTVAVVGAFSIGLALSGHQTAGGADALLSEVRQQLVHDYYREVPASVLAAPTVAEMLRELDDPYTDYLDPTQFRLLRRETASSYSGIGVSVVPVAGGLEVTALKERGPAKRAGLRVGDLIASIDGAAVTGKPMDQIVASISGSSGTSVSLGVLRDGRSLPFTLVRERISAPTVQTRLLQDGKLRVGYLSLSAFRLGATPVLGRALARLRHAHVTGLVLDLRDNPGGVFDQAVGVASLFLDRGVIVTIVGVHSGRHVYSARPGSTKLPLVVLVDHDSASSAEIVAAALQDHRRAVVIGENTFGKAVVQSIRPLENGAALRLTTARYLTPDGTDISLHGVTPDLRVVDNPRTRVDEMLRAALNLFSKSRS